MLKDAKNVNSSRGGEGHPGQRGQCEHRCGGKKMLKVHI